MRDASFVITVFRKVRSAGRLLGASLRKLYHAILRARYQRKARNLFVSSWPDEPSSVVVFCPSGFDGAFGHYAVIAKALNARNVATIFVQAPFFIQRRHDDRFSQFENSIVRRSRNEYHSHSRGERDLRFSWTIDLNRGLFVAIGLNFWPAVLGMLRRDFKRYDIDFSDQHVIRTIEALLVSADCALGVCVDLYERFSRKGTSIRILAAELNYVPGGIFNIFCNEMGGRLNMEFVDYGPAYSSYFTGEMALGSSYACMNLTRNGLHTRFEPVPARFAEWLANGQDGVSARRKMMEVIRLNRLSVNGTEEKTAIIDRLKIHRKAGGKVTCIFGHMSFDLAGPNDCGPAHSDMKEWIQNSLDTLQTKDDVLVLIKPHIGEVRHKENQKPNQMLKDMLPDKLSKNVILLKADTFNAHELYEYIDLGLVWRSSVALELMILGIPTIVACEEAYYWKTMFDYMITPTDRENYRALLTGSSTLQVPPEAGNVAALLLKYIATQTFIEMPYTEKKRFLGRRQPVTWNTKSLRKFLSDGDPSVERVCDEILSR